MRIAYLDCFSGISGDMFLGALVDAGVSRELLEQTVAALNIGATLEFSQVDRSGITATKVDVIVAGEKDMPREVFHAHHHDHPHDHGHSHSEVAPVPSPAGPVSHHHDHSHDHGHSHSEVAPVPSPAGPLPHHHDHPHDHGHSHSEVAPVPSPAGPVSHHHDHSHNHGHSHPEVAPVPSPAGPVSHDHDHPHLHGRSLRDIRAIIAACPITPAAKQRATAIFDALGRAEAKIHNKDLDTIHFHEVGSADAIVDIVCAAVGSEALGIDEWVCSPLNVGGGTIVCAHGTFPVPAPATVELLQSRNAPIFSTGIQKELVTPTGAAIVSVLANRFAPFPAMKVEKTGYGAGYRDLPGQANVLRLTLGTQAEQMSTLPTETVCVMETTIDDMTAQMFGHFLDRALDAGALDAFLVPVQMKKNRPGMLLTVLTRPEDRERIARLVFAETTTIGLRIRNDQRYALARKQVHVETRWGTIRIKTASFNETEANCAPEYEDCRRVAAESGVPLKAVMQEAIRVYLQSSEQKKHE